MDSFKRFIIKGPLQVPLLGSISYGKDNRVDFHKSLLENFWDKASSVDSFQASSWWHSHDRDTPDASIPTPGLITKTTH